MKKLACQYALINIMPSPDSGELANIGVALACPERRFFGYRLQTARAQRYTQFFPSLTRSHYLAAARYMESALRSRAEQINGCDPEVVRLMFAALTHPREAIVRFSSVRFAMADSPDELLAQLYARYVSKAGEEHGGDLFAAQLEDLLNGLSLKRPFLRDVQVGDDFFSTTLPFARDVDGGKAERGIKPLNFARMSHNEIYDSATSWIGKMRRLKNRGHLGTGAFFVTTPDATDATAAAAYDEVTREMADMGLRIFPAYAKSPLVDFATT